MQLARFIIPYRKSNLAMEIPQISKNQELPLLGEFPRGWPEESEFNPSTHGTFGFYIPIHPNISPSYSHEKTYCCWLKHPFLIPSPKKNHPIFSPWHVFCFFHWPLRGFWGEDRQRLLPTEALGWWEVEGCRVYPWQLWSGEVVVGSC